MQTLARGTLSAAQVKALITAPVVEVSAGLELLDASNQVVEDISADLVSGDVSRDNYAEVHGDCRLSITRQLAWGRDRVRPYMTLTDGSAAARFDLGVYVLTTPQTHRGEDPPTWSVTGYDLLHLLQDGPGDTYAVAAGTAYLQAVRDVVSAAGVGATVRLDGTRQDTTIPKDRVWALADDSGSSWVEIINDLLAEIGYVEVYANETGELRSQPYQPIGERPTEWVLDTSDDATNIVGEDRTVAEDVWSAPNRWRFVRRQMDYQPYEGDGIYTVTNQAEGPASVDSLGRTVTKVVYLDAADQVTLMVQGDRIVAEDQQVIREVELALDPLPAQWHRDVFELRDDGVTERLEAASWTLPLDGSPGRLLLGGDRPTARTRTETQAQATVTSAAPLRVVVDGASVDSVANALDAATYSVGQRVSVTVRNPLPPLVQGVETGGA